MKTNKVFAAVLVALLAVFSKNMAYANPTLRSLTMGAQSPNPASSGGLVYYSFTVTRTGTGSLDAYLSASGLPAGASVSFVPPKVSFNDGGPSTKSAVMVVRLAAGTPAGTYPITLQAQKGNSQNLLVCTNVLVVGAVNVVIAQSPFLNIPVPQSDSTKLLSGGGTALQPILIQACTNLTSTIAWETIGVQTLDSSGLFSFIDQDATNFPARFYRAAQ